MRFAPSALLLLALLGCSKTDPKPLSTAGSASPPLPSASVATTGNAAPPLAAPSDKPRNVLLLTIDSLRADMPWNGYARNIAPNIAALADKCTTYQNAYSVSSYTAKSVA